MKIQKYFLNTEIFRIFLCILCFSSYPQSIFSNTDWPYDISYQIYHNISIPNNPKLKLTCTINPNVLIPQQEKGKNYFYLHLPRQWSSAKNLYTYVQNLQALNDGAEIIDLEDPSTKKIIFNASTQAVSFSYEIDSKKNRNILAPIINKDIFHFIGHAALVTPQLEIGVNENKVLKIQYSIQSHDQNSVEILNNTLYKFRHTVFAGGAYQLDKIQADNMTVFSYNLSQETKNFILQSLNTIVPIQKKFWGENQDNNKVIFLHADDFMLATMIGTQNNGVISIGMNETSPFLKEDLPVFLAHEYWHSWMGNKFHSAPSYRDMAWLFEGVTDYYAHKTTYQAELLSISSWKEKYNRILAAHYLSPVKNKSNQEIVEYFDEDAQYDHLPYTRGTMIAFELDNKIKKLSNDQYSLDSVIKDVFAKEKDSAVTMKHFCDSLKRFYPDAEQFIQTHIEEGKDITLSSDFFNEPIRLQWVALKPQEYGIDVHASLITKIVKGLSKKTRAYKKGLREDQVILSHTIDNQDDNQPIFLRVLGKNGKEQFFLLERIGKPVLAPRYVMES